MLALRRIRSLSCICHSSISCLQLDLPQRKAGTYSVGDATNIKWFEGAVPRWGPLACVAACWTLSIRQSCAFQGHLTTKFPLRVLHGVPITFRRARSSSRGLALSCAMKPAGGHMRAEWRKKGVLGSAAACCGLRG